jgi:uncharacterized protein
MKILKETPELHNFTEAINEIINKYYVSNDAHDKSHVMAVLNNSIKIAKHYKCDLVVVALSAALHDSTRKIDDATHHITGAMEAITYLENNKVDVTQEQISHISQCIQSHRYSSRHEHTDISIEAQILQDADRIDTLGSRGLNRCLTFADKISLPLFDAEVYPNEEYTGYSHSTINHLIEKILPIKQGDFHLEQSKKIINDDSIIEDFIINHVVGNTAEHKWMDIVDGIIKNKKS